MRKFFNRNNSRDVLPDRIDADCYGEKCANYVGSNCPGSSYDFMSAYLDNGDKSYAPPLRDLARCAMYGRVCFEGDSAVVVSRRIDIYGSVDVPEKLLEDIGKQAVLPMEMVIHPAK